MSREAASNKKKQKNRTYKPKKKYEDHSQTVSYRQLSKIVEAANKQTNKQTSKLFFFLFF